MSGDIFISYRREDSRDITGRLVDRLKQTYARRQLFLDIETIDLGRDFEQILAKMLKDCKVLIAVIGREWLDAKDENGRRRLDDPNDYVRREIAAALQRDIRVIPVLVDDAAMPPAEQLPDDLKPLVKRQKMDLSYEKFGSDMESLVASLAETVRPEPRTAKWVMIAAASAVAVAVVAAIIWFAAFQPAQPPSTPTQFNALATQLCTEATDVTARLSSTRDAEVWTKARARFWELYNGSLYIIETEEKNRSAEKTSEIERSMVAFGKLLEPLGDRPGATILPAVSLSQPSLRVARACSAFLRNL